VPNITQNSLSKWSQEDIARLLANGELPDGDSVGGNMGKVVGNTSKLGDADRSAMAAYIKSLPPLEGPKKPERR
jgi:hypothetical protein